MSLLASQMATGQLAVRGRTVYTMEGPPISNGIVLIRNGLIQEVGSESSVKIPSGYTVVEAKVVTPGLIDSHAVVWSTSFFNPLPKRDLMAMLTAIDHYNEKKSLCRFYWDDGVTTIQTDRDDKRLVDGQLMVVKTKGDVDNEAAVVKPFSMLAVTLGETYIDAPEYPRIERRQIFTRLRAELRNLSARPTAGRTSKTSRGRGSDARSNALRRVLKREIPLLVSVESLAEATAAIQLGREFNLDVVLDANRAAYQSTTRTILGKVAMIADTYLNGPGWGVRKQNVAEAAVLKSRSAPVALQSGGTRYVSKGSILRSEARQAMMDGLSLEEALALLTVNPARILGIDKKTGSIAEGKAADLALFDGAPFDSATHTVGVIIDGVVVYRPKD